MWAVCPGWVALLALQMLDLKLNGICSVCFNVEPVSQTVAQYSANIVRFIWTVEIF